MSAETVYFPLFTFLSLPPSPSLPTYLLPFVPDHTCPLVLGPFLVEARGAGEGDGELGRGEGREEGGEVISRCM